MDDFRDYADQLQQEVVSDMAGSYFGSRKELEDRISAFHQKVEELRVSIPKLRMAASRLHMLLLDKNTIDDFYISLGVSPSCIPFVEEVTAPLGMSIPFAFTLRGRYERSVCRAYHLFRDVADEYLNGRYYDDPEHPGRKLHTVNYLRLKDMAGDINEDVERVNNSLPPSRALEYIKQMDTHRMEQEKIMGEVCELEGCALDKDLQFQPIDFEANNLPVIQELPGIKAVRSTIVSFCRNIYPDRKTEIVAILEEFKQ